MDTGYLWPVLGFIGGWAGSFFGSYLKKKGENLATREDIKGLVEQVSAVTTATKNIEARISGELWNRQKQWELKRDVLLDAMKRLGSLPSELTSLRRVMRPSAGPGLSPENRLEEAQKWMTSMAGFDATVHVVTLICGSDVAQAFLALSVAARDVGGLSLQGQESSFDEKFEEFSEKQRAAVDAARKELGVTGLFG